MRKEVRAGCKVKLHIQLLVESLGMRSDGILRIAHFVNIVLLPWEGCSRPEGFVAQQMPRN
jgi:hypothetical protein